MYIYNTERKTREMRLGCDSDPLAVSDTYVICDGTERSEDQQGFAGESAALLRLPVNAEEMAR